MENEFNLRKDNNENDDFCRGYNESPYKVNINDKDDIIDEYQLNNYNYIDNQKNINDNINDIAPEMPSEFYRNVESFLSKAPPKINDTMSTKVKKLTNKTIHTEKEMNHQSNNTQITGLMFPRINTHLNPPQPPSNSSSNNHHNNNVAITINNNNNNNNNSNNNDNKASKVKSKIYNDANKKNKSQIDHKLLQEAFEYTDMLLKESILHCENEEVISDEYHVLPNNKNNNNNNSKNHISSNHNRINSLENIYNTTNNNSNYNNNSNDKKNKIKMNSTNAVGIIKKLRNKSQSNIKIGNNNISKLDINNNNSNFMIGINDNNDNIEDKKNIINFNELIINFQDGITLQKLKKDLEESQKSMKKSEDFMKQLSKEFSINKKR